MKKFVALCALVVGFIAFTGMQTSNLAEFKFQTEVHDFGKVPVGKPVSFVFKFTNVGDQPLIITAVEPACGCTTGDYTKTPVKKGESGSITLTFNAASAAPFTKVATIRSNSKTPEKVLYLKGEVVEVPKTAAN